MILAREDKAVISVSEMLKNCQDYLREDVAALIKGSYRAYRISTDFSAVVNV
jgi:hypothetical protein